jgi:enterochelin esterase-like enzyme
VTGLVLVSPFLGDEVPEEIREAGLAKWEAGELAPKMDGENYERHVWNMIKGWRNRPQLARRVWLACGTEDALFKDAQLLAPEVPRDHYLTRPGGHNWAYWIPAIEDTFRRIAVSRS